MSRAVDCFAVCGLSASPVTVSGDARGFVGAEERYLPEVLSSYPSTSSAGNNEDVGSVLAQLALMCMPEGVDVHIRDPPKEALAPRMYPLVLTEPDGALVHVMCLSFLEPVSDAARAAHPALRSACARKCLCLVSRARTPMSVLRAILRAVHRTCFVRARRDAPPLADVVAALVDGVPFPERGAPPALVTVFGRPMVVPAADDDDDATDDEGVVASEDGEVEAIHPPGHPSPSSPTLTAASFGNATREDDDASAPPKTSGPAWDASATDSGSSSSCARWTNATRSARRARWRKNAECCSGRGTTRCWCRRPWRCCGRFARCGGATPSCRFSRARWRRRLWRARGRSSSGSRPTSSRRRRRWRTRWWWTWTRTTCAAWGTPRGSGTGPRATAGSRAPSPSLCSRIYGGWRRASRAITATEPKTKEPKTKPIARCPSGRASPRTPPLRAPPHAAGGGPRTTTTPSANPSARFGAGASAGTARSCAPSPRLFQKARRPRAVRARRARKRRSTPGFSTPPGSTARRWPRRIAARAKPRRLCAWWRRRRRSRRTPDRRSRRREATIDIQFARNLDARRSSEASRTTPRTEAARPPRVRRGRRLHPTTARCSMRSSTRTATSASRWDKPGGPAGTNGKFAAAVFSGRPSPPPPSQSTFARVRSCARGTRVFCPRAPTQGTRNDASSR